MGPRPARLVPVPRLCLLPSWPAPGLVERKGCSRGASVCRGGLGHSLAAPRSKSLWRAAGTGAVGSLSFGGVRPITTGFGSYPSWMGLKWGHSQMCKLRTGPDLHRLLLSSAPPPWARHCSLSVVTWGRGERQGIADASRLRAPVLLGQGSWVHRHSRQTKALTAPNRNVMI